MRKNGYKKIIGSIIDWKLNKNIILVLGGILCLSLVFPGKGYGFRIAIGPIHQNITERILKKIEIPLGDGILQSFSNKAIQEIVDSNKGVDCKEIFSSECNDTRRGIPTLDYRSWQHFDDESFSIGISRLASLKIVIVDNLSGRFGTRDAALARRYLGEALHTIQDFYSHSNWIEQGKNNTFPLLIHFPRELPGEFLFSGKGDNTCGTFTDSEGNTQVSTGNLIEFGKLTSGYWDGCEDGIGPGLKGDVTGNKCCHGSSNKENLSGIHKDYEGIKFPLNFEKARNLAESSTREYILSILQDPAVDDRGKQILLKGLLYGQVVDVSQEMAPSLVGFKALVPPFVRSSVNAGTDSSQYLLGTFNRSEGDSIAVTLEDEGGPYADTLDGLQANGVGNCPQLRTDVLDQALALVPRHSSMSLWHNGNLPFENRAALGKIRQLAAEQNVSFNVFGADACALIPLPTQGYSFERSAGSGQLLSLQGTIFLNNSGSQPMAWSLDKTAESGWLKIPADKQSGTLNPGETAVLLFEADPSILQLPVGEHTGGLVVTNETTGTAHQAIPIELKLTTPPDSGCGPGGCEI